MCVFVGHFMSGKLLLASNQQAFTAIWSDMSGEEPSKVQWGPPKLDRARSVVYVSCSFQPTDVYSLL